MNEENDMVPIDEKLNITKSETENIKNLIWGCCKRINFTRQQPLLHLIDTAFLLRCFCCVSQGCSCDFLLFEAMITGG